MKRIIMICLMVAITSFKVSALDNEVTILAVYTPTTATKTSTMTQAMAYAQSVWDNLGISTPIQFANGGIPVALSSSLGGSSADMTTQINQAHSSSQISSLRSSYKADVILIFSAGSTSKCGITNVRFWNNASNDFVADADQLDLRDSNIRYISVVNMSCNEDNSGVAHEFGHIFGADHLTEPGLYSDSLGYRSTRTVVIGKGSEPEIITIQNSSPMATPALGVCSADICANVKFYSTSQYAAYGDSAHNNRRAIAKTARSVANYQKGVIVIKKPIALSGYIVNACTETGATEHSVLWTEGGSSVQVSHYEIWAKQGSEYYYTYRWDAVGLAHTPAFVWGNNAYLRVKACFGDLCSELSDSWYLAQNTCNSATGENDTNLSF